MNQIQLLVQPDGSIKTLYTEELDLSKFGKLTVERASHVEFDDAEQTWAVKLVRTGEIIGSGFSSRKKALDFEVEYLNNKELT